MYVKVLVFGILYHLILANENSSLELIQVLFRHGDRTPTEIYKNDPNKIWPEGLGQLTNKGKNQMYQLGLRLRDEYKTFLSDYYSPDKVFVLSSALDRTRMSAELVLAGLFPPVREQIWNSKLLWQPIPVNYTPRKQDNLISMKKDCVTYKREFEAALDSEKMKRINEENMELFQYLSKYSGQEMRDIRDVETFYNTLTIEEENGREIPEWTQNLSKPLLHTLASESLAFYSTTPIMRRLQGGPLLKKITTEMVDKGGNNLKPNYDLIMYSSHDLTIVSLWKTMGFEELLKPDYGATMVFELHDIENEYEIRFLFRKNYTSKLEKLNIPFCNEPCLLNTFMEQARLLYPENWERECSNL